MSTLNRIILENISLYFRQTLILKEINWTIKANEHWVITGNGGVGKTILAEALAGKRRLQTGQLTYPFLGEAPSFMERRAAIQMISFMDTSKLFKSVNAVHYYQQRFNSFDSDGHLTVRQYLEDGGINIAEHHRLLESIGIDDLLDLDRIKLSSGQTRKMLLAKVMLRQPKILIIDNPYIGLDKGSRLVLNELLDELVAQTDMTLILAGHHQALPNCISHRLHIHDDRSIEKGSLVNFEDIPFSKDINEKALLEIKALFKTSLFPHNPPSPLKRGISPQRSFEIASTYSENFIDIIRFENVNIQYDDKHILKNLNWTVKQGEKWAVIGPNGSGKSTVLSLIYADNPQAYGNAIYLFDQRRGAGESIWDVKRRIGFTSPELHAYFDENLSAQKVVLTGLTDTFTILKKPSLQQLDFTKLLFDYFELQAERDKQFNQLSTGIQRLLLLMRALVKAPPVLLLDEPFQGLDALTVFRCKYLIDTILTEKHTLLFISHFKQELPDCVVEELVL